MSSLAPTELSITPDEGDSSKITITTNTSKLILENNSPDVTISKLEAPGTFTNLTTTNSQMTMKTQVLPLVYIQNPPKVPFATTNNVIVNNIPPLQFATLGGNITNNTPTTTVNQNVIFATGRQPLLFQKQGNVVPIVPSGTKITGAYLTMLKQVQTPNETTVNKIIANTAMPKLQDFSVLSNSKYIQHQSTSQKFVIAPMPKLTTNRLPATATTNSVQPKIALLPMPVPSTEPMETKKVYNLQIQNESSNMATSVCDLSNDNSLDADSNSENLVCDEVIDLESPEKNDISNQAYQLSIAEESSNSQSDVKIGSKKDWPKVQHGVSILKKHYITERKLEKSDNITNSLNTVSENKGDMKKQEDEDVILTIPERTEKERRRKSNFCYRKDFDEIDLTVSTPKTEPAPYESVITKVSAENPKKNLTNELEIELINDKSEASFQGDQDTDLHKILSWENGVGTLPGSSIRFIVNEFNMVEYITDNEYKALLEKKSLKEKESKADVQEEMRCLECGCFGLPSDFFSPKYCSYECHDINLKKIKQRRLEKQMKVKKKRQREDGKSDSRFEKDEDMSDEDSNDNSSQDKFSDKATAYPWACKKKGFSWSKYLDHVKAKAAPVKLFKDPFPYTRNGFRTGMKLEGIDPQHPSYFCVLTVAEVVGYRIRLHFDGYPENYDFWCNADTMDIFPAGWCEKYGHTLQPPAGYTSEEFNWVQYLKQTRSTAAPKHLFANRAGQAICPNGFRVGMKLEAVDRKNTALVCVATVRDMMDNRILVHFDSWDDIYDYWADPTSPYIHPVGWCDQYGHNLTPPNGKNFPNPELFTWESYLKQTKSVAAPVRAFKQRPACGFKRGMRLECVDRRVPQLIRVATVDDVKEHQIRIHFDGWLDRYSYWVDDDSPDIHPVGWCQKTGHPIEPPLTPDDVYDFLECPTVGCRGLGHIRGPKFGTHSTQKYCPYAEENIDVEKIVPDRLLSPDRTPASVEPISREPKECKLKPRVGRPPKNPRLEPPPRLERCGEPPEKKVKRQLKKVKSERLDANEQKNRASELINFMKIPPAERESWAKHSQFLKRYIKMANDPRRWSNRDVMDFVLGLSCCDINVDVFRKEQIDGEALLALSQKDILSMLKFKMGPAVKLYNSIVLLRQRVDEKRYV
ncbi:unnamed protein product [Acanthoscelides obtectus]|uniref:SAM domain-containing protein n=1 Tax=Acanthoscelides obtectus TaxID=200917 RepID=A0A9P0LFQ8_ACAOB|nr:unnamed protein product [Acanthoscelides obtectus]CAK1626562.1 Lethal(3)malignant brain tumor-like protein 1 [Acanthoscelides obtectus]